MGSVCCLSQNSEGCHVSSQSKWYHHGRQKFRKKITEAILQHPFLEAFLYLGWWTLYPHCNSEKSLDSCWLHKQVMVHFYLFDHFGESKFGRCTLFKSSISEISSSSWFDLLGVPIPKISVVENFEGRDWSLSGELARDLSLLIFVIFPIVLFGLIVAFVWLIKLFPLFIEKLLAEATLADLSVSDLWEKIL